MRGKYLNNCSISCSSMHYKFFEEKKKKNNLKKINNALENWWTLRGREDSTGSFCFAQIFYHLGMDGLNKDHPWVFTDEESKLGYRMRHVNYWMDIAAIYIAHPVIQLWLCPPTNHQVP